MALTFRRVSLSCLLSAAFTLAAMAAEHDGPEYNVGYTSGLYATIAGYNSCKDQKLDDLQEFRLCVDRFNCSVEAHAIIQPGEAPLAVVLLGAEGRALDPVSKRYVSWLAEAGYHVVGFNSTLQKDFVNICGRGVSGNIEGETECVRDMIAAFIKRPEMAGKVSKIGIVGLSYGGVEALLLARMQEEGKLKEYFEIKAVQAYSPPVDMHRSIEFLDRWWREDRWKYSLTDLYREVARHKPVSPGCECPLSDSQMRAGLAATFRLDLVDVVERNDAQFNLNILPPARDYLEQVRRNDYAAKWSFTRFLREVSYPYWKDRLGLKSFSDFNAGAKLPALLPKMPGYVEIYIANDDPLNDGIDLDIARNTPTKAKVLYLKGGGHIGYVNLEWTKWRLQHLFPSQAPDSPKPPTPPLDKVNSTSK